MPGPAKTTASSTRSRAGRASAPAHEGEKSPEDATSVNDTVAGPGRTKAQIDAERAAAQPKQVSGPGSGNRLLGALQGQDEDGQSIEQDEVDLTKVAEVDPATIKVQLKHDVYEEFLAPGSTTRYIRQLLWRKGRYVSKAELDRHIASQRKAKKAKGDDDPAETGDPATDNATGVDDPTGGTGGE